MIGVAVDGIGLYVRNRERKKIIAQVKERYDYHVKHSPIVREVLIIKSPKDEQACKLFKLKDSSAIVFFDCALELSNTEDELNRLWNEAVRVSGSKIDSNNANKESNVFNDLFVLNIQKWSSNRLNLDPRVRWIITEAPPRSNEFRYEPFGVRNPILAETRLENRIRKGKKL